jgi:hypothetical protein
MSAASWVMALAFVCSTMPTNKISLLPHGIQSRSKPSPHITSHEHKS